MVGLMAKTIRAVVYKVSEGWRLCTVKNPLMNFVFKSKRDAYSASRCLGWRATRQTKLDTK